MDGIKRCKCVNCHQAFRPEPRNAWHQRYCGASACRAASKAASQRHWLAKPENREYFRGPEHVERVRAWRQAHPGYSRRASASPSPPSPAATASAAPSGSAMSVAPLSTALQDVVLTQVPAAQGESGQQAALETAAPAALQDFLQHQPVVLIGLLAHLSASTLQDDIAQAGQRLLQLGHDVLGGARA